MDPEQTFVRVQERMSQMVRPKVRAVLEYLYLFIAITLFCILVVMHANYVQQPGCSSELSGVDMKEAQLIQIKITSVGLWSHNESESNAIDVPDLKTVTNKLEIANVEGDGLTFLAAKFWLNWVGSGTRRTTLAWKFWKTDTELLEHQAEPSLSCPSSKPKVDDTVIRIDKEERRSFPLSARETFKAAVFHFGKKWYKRLLFIWRHAVQLIRSFWKLWNLAGINLNIDIPKWLRIFHLDRLNSYAVHSLEKRITAFEPIYIYTREKGYFLLPEEARSRHNIRTVNISISARHSCFGNRWQQLLINRIVGYDTILMNSLLTSTDQGHKLHEFAGIVLSLLPLVHVLFAVKTLPDRWIKMGDVDAFLCTLGFNLPPIENGDRMRWKLTKNGDFDIRSFYNKLRGPVPIIFPWKSVWKVKAPRRVSFFVWTAVWDKILTGDNLRGRGIVFVDWCIMCHCNGEMVDHLLLHCGKAYRL